jgi:uncharacterized Tic20 family protein
MGFWLPRRETPMVESKLDSEASNWGMLAHLSALVGLVIPFGNIIGPLVIWLTKGKENAFVEGEAREAINFQITMTIGFVVCWLLAFILIGFFLVMILGIVDLVLVIIATINASKGEAYRYPFTLRLVK